MSSTTSSPFLEHPKDMLDEESDFNLKQTISRLRFQLSTMKSEKRLKEQEEESIRSHYEDIIMKKNEELKNIRDNFDFIYEQKTQADSKLENKNQIMDKKLESLRAEVDKLTREKMELKSWGDNIEFQFKNTTKRYDQVRHDFNYQLTVNDQLEDQVKNLKNEIISLKDCNTNLSNKIGDLSSNLKDNSTNLLVNSLQSKNLSLQKTNNHLQVKVDELLQNRTSVELLRQKNTSLLSRINHLEDVEEKFSQLGIENLELKNRLQDFLKVMDKSLESEKVESVETRVTLFLNSYKLLVDEKLVFQDKFSESQIELNLLRTQNAELQIIINELNPKIESIGQIVKAKDELIDKLARQKLLNSKEIEYLRDQLKEHDQVNLKKENTERNNSKYLANLENLVDEYKREVGSLQHQLSELAKLHKDDVSGEKRRRLDADDSVTLTFRSRVIGLENENALLRSQIKQLQGLNEDLNAKINNFETMNSKKKEHHILQLKNNPVSKDQIIKQETLDALKKENENLINEYVRGQQVNDLIPKSVFERQEADAEELRRAINQLEKRNNRLKEIFAKKSKDILTIISKYFGYSIEFLPSPINPNDLSSRIKLISRYLKSNSYDSNSSSYLIIDLESKSLKAYGDQEFKALCMDLISNWIDERGQIPCLLSALNLKVYETYVLDK